MNAKSDHRFMFNDGGKLRVGLRWTCTAPVTADLDLSCLLLDGYANIADVVHYNKLSIPGVEHSGDDRVGLPIGIHEGGYNERIDVDLDELALANIVCIIFYVSSYNGTMFKDCRFGSVQVQHATDSKTTEHPDHLFIYETKLKTKSDYTGLVPFMFLYDAEQMSWEMTVLNEWIRDCHFLDGIAKVLNRKVLPNAVWASLSDRLEHKILETLNKELKLQKKRRTVNRKRIKNAQDPIEDKSHDDRQNIMETTIKNEVRELINPDKEPFVMDPETLAVLQNPKDKKLFKEHAEKIKQKLREAVQKSKSEQDDSIDEEESDDEESDEMSKRPSIKEYPATSIEIKDESSSVVELGLGWNSKAGHLHSHYFLGANLIYFGKYGHKISFIDQRTSAKVRSCTYYPPEYRKSGKNDKVLAVKLNEVDQNVKSIVFVIVAGSNTDFHGLIDLRNPYVKLSSKDGVELFRYGFPDAAFLPSSTYYSLIAFKLVRTYQVNGPEKWTIVPICELSDGTHGLFHDKLRGQIAKHVDRLIEPERTVLVSNATKAADNLDEEALSIVKSTYEFSSKDVSNVGIDFTCIKNIKEIACFELGKNGDMKNTRAISVHEKQDLSQRKMSIQMSGLSYLKNNDKTPEMLVSATSFMRLNLDRLYTEGVHQIVWVLTFKELIEDDPLDNDRCIIDDDWSNVFRVWNINDRNDLASCLMSNVYNVDGKFENFTDTNLCGSVVAKLTRTGDDKWSLDCVDEIIPFKTRLTRYLDSKRLKQTKYIKSIEKYVNTPPPINRVAIRGSEKKDAVPEPYDLELPGDLIVGVGVDDAKPVHILEMNVELYDHCGSFLDDLNKKHPKVRENMLYPFRQLYLATGNDSEQFTITRTVRTPIRHYAVTVQAKCRGYLGAQDTVYVRVCNKQTCEELVRVNCAAGPVIGKYNGRKINMEAVKAVQDMSDDEESYGSDKEEDEPFILLAVISFTQTGWRIVPAGRLVQEPELYKLFIPPPPTHIKIEVIEALDVKPMDKNGLCDPYVKLKYKSSKALKKKSKQKYQTKTQFKTLAPKFNETCEFAVTSPDDVILISMFDHDGPLRVRHELIGVSKMDIYNAISNANEGTITALNIIDEGKVHAKLKLRTSRIWK